MAARWSWNFRKQYENKQKTIPKDRIRPVSVPGRRSALKRLAAAAGSARTGAATFRRRPARVSQRVARVAGCAHCPSFEAQCQGRKDQRRSKEFPAGNTRASRSMTVASLAGAGDSLLRIRWGEGGRRSVRRKMKSGSRRWLIFFGHVKACIMLDFQPAYFPDRTCSKKLV